ncbi:MAG: hypothetical protein QG608_2930 [Actinomycetota bacterium]|nr:hypothetical protein [Actinomycetota bacterium]
MTDLDALLRDVLHRQADRVTPSTDLLSRVHHRSDHLRRRRRVTTGVTILTAMSVSVLVVSNLDRAPGPEPVPPAVSPTVFPSPVSSSGITVFTESPPSVPRTTGAVPTDPPSKAGITYTEGASRNSPQPDKRTEISGPSPTSVSSVSPTNSTMTDLRDTWSATPSYHP